MITSIRIILSLVHSGQIHCMCTHLLARSSQCRQALNVWCRVQLSTICGNEAPASQNSGETESVSKMADPRHRMIHPAVCTLDEDLSQMKTLGFGTCARAYVAHGTIVYVFNRCSEL